MNERITIKPGEAVPASGIYEEVTREGALLGVASVNEGDPAPPTDEPGAVWRPLFLTRDAEGARDGILVSRTGLASLFAEWGRREGTEGYPSAEAYGAACADYLISLHAEMQA